jgi:hypothetical protein
MHYQRTMPDSTSADRFAAALASVKAHLAWIRYIQPRFHCYISQQVARHTQAACKAAGEATAAQQRWEKRDQERPPLPMQKQHSLIASELALALQEARHRTQLATISTDTLAPVPEDPLEETAKQVAIRTRRPFQRLLPETLEEFLNRATQSYRKEFHHLPRVIRLTGEDLNWLMLLGYTAGVYSNSEGVFSLREDRNLPKNQIILE